MEKKEFKKKLFLNKETIEKLNRDLLFEIKGGEVAATTYIDPIACITFSKNGNLSCNACPDTRQDCPPACVSGGVGNSDKCIPSTQ